MSGLAERLRRARQALGLTHEMVERETGIGTSSLSEFESGKQQPRLAQLRLLAKCYRQPLGYFLREEEPRPQAVLWCFRLQDETAETPAVREENEDSPN